MPKTQNLQLLGGELVDRLGIENIRSKYEARKAAKSGTLNEIYLNLLILSYPVEFYVWIIVVP